MKPQTGTDKGGKGREGAITFTLKNVTIEDVDEANAALTVQYGNKEKPSKVVNLAVAKQIRVVASHVLPSVGNNLPFHWQQLKDLKGKQASLKLRVEADQLSVVSVSVRND